VKNPKSLAYAVLGYGRNFGARLQERNGDEYACAFSHFP